MQNLFQHLIYFVSEPQVIISSWQEVKLKKKKKEAMNLVNFPQSIFWLKHCADMVRACLRKANKSPESQGACQSFGLDVVNMVELGLYNSLEQQPASPDSHNHSADPGELSRTAAAQWAWLWQMNSHYGGICPVSSTGGTPSTFDLF